MEPNRHAGASYAPQYPSSEKSREERNEPERSTAMTVATVDGASAPNRVGESVRRAVATHERAAISLGVLVLVGPAQRPATRSVQSRVRRLTAAVGRMNELLELRTPDARESFLIALEDLLEEADNLASDLMGDEP